MRAADSVNRAVGRDRRSHVNAGSLRATVDGWRHRVGTRRPRQQAAVELYFARGIRGGGGGDEGIERHFRDRAIGGNLHQPGAHDIFAPRVVAAQLDGIVVHITGGVGGQRPGDIGIRINIVVAERIVAGNDRAIGAVQFVNRAAKARVIDEIADQHAVIDRLPDRAAKRHRLPIALEIPHLNQLAVLPTEPPLIPGLRLPCRQIGIRPRLEFHEHVVAINQRRLVVNEEVGFAEDVLARRLLLFNEGVINDVGEHLIRALPNDIDAAAVAGVMAPLRPARAATGCIEQAHLFRL